MAVLGSDCLRRKDMMDDDQAAMTENSVGSEAVIELITTFCEEGESGARKWMKLAPGLVMDLGLRGIRVQGGWMCIYAFHFALPRWVGVSGGGRWSEGGFCGPATSNYEDEGMKVWISCNKKNDLSWWESRP